MYSVQFVVCSVQYAVCSMQCAVCSVQYVVCSMQGAESQYKIGWLPNNDNTDKTVTMSSTGRQTCPFWTCPISRQLSSADRVKLPSIRTRASENAQKGAVLETGLYLVYGCRYQSFTWTLREDLKKVILNNETILKLNNSFLADQLALPGAALQTGLWFID